MRITVIGSGSMWTKYNSACFQIDDNVIIDFPNGTCKYLYRLNIIPSNIEYVLLTHFHGDHYFDLPFFILNKSRSKNKNITIYCSKEGKRKINKIGDLAFPLSYRNALKEIKIKYANIDNFKIGNYEITRLRVDHGRMKPAFGYMFKYDNIYIGFTGDTTLCESVEKMAEKCNYLICDCMFIKATKKHQGIDTLEYLSAKYPECQIVACHLNNETRQTLKEMNIKNVIVPEDGEIIDVK